MISRFLSRATSMARLLPSLASTLLAVSIVAVFVAGEARAHDEDNPIGVATSVVNEVVGSRHGETFALAAGDEVFLFDVIETGPNSAAQILFNDRTSLTMGEDSRLTLNRYVYDPATGVADIAIGAAKGGFRFISGVGGPGSYQVQTPRATVGVRGSITEVFVDAATGAEVHLLLQGQLDFCPVYDPKGWAAVEDRAGVSCGLLDNAGRFVVVDQEGDVGRATTFRGQAFSPSASVTLARQVLEQSLNGGADPHFDLFDSNDALGGP